MKFSLYTIYMCGGGSKCAIFYRQKGGNKSVISVYLLRWDRNFSISIYNQFCDENKYTHTKIISNKQYKWDTLLFNNIIYTFSGHMLAVNWKYYLLGKRTTTHTHTQLFFGGGFMNIHPDQKKNLYNNFQTLTVCYVGKNCTRKIHFYYEKQTVKISFLQEMEPKFWWLVFFN